jgi:hypothetical protein
MGCSSSNTTTINNKMKTMSLKYFIDTQALCTVSPMCAKLITNASAQHQVLHPDAAPAVVVVAVVIAEL